MSSPTKNDGAKFYFFFKDFEAKYYFISNIKYDFALFSEKKLLDLLEDVNKYSMQSLFGEHVHYTSSKYYWKMPDMSFSFYIWSPDPRHTTLLI